MTPTRELLIRLIKPKSEYELFELLRQYPELDSYIAPMVAAFKGLGLLLAAGSTSCSKAGMDYPAFLTEESYQMLDALVEANRATRDVSLMEEVLDSLRITLDMGLNKEWAIKELNYPEPSPEKIEDWQHYQTFRELLEAADREGLARLVSVEPWLKPYAEQLPIKFSSSQIAMRRALAVFIYDGFGPAYRAQHDHPELYTDGLAWMKSVIGISEREGHHALRREVADEKEFLLECQEKGAEDAFLDRLHSLPDRTGTRV